MIIPVGTNFGFRFGFVLTGGLVLAVHGGGELVGTMVQIQIDTVGTGLNGNVGTATGDFTVGSTPVQTPCVVAGELELGILSEGLVNVEAVQVDVVGHLHVGIGLIPTVECAHDTYIAEAVLLGEDQGAGVQGEHVETVLAILGDIGITTVLQLELAGFCFRGRIIIHTPVTGAVVPAGVAGELELYTVGVLFTQIQQAGEGVAALVVVVGELEHLFVAPGTQDVNATDRIYMRIQVLIQDNGGVRSEGGSHHIGIHNRSGNGSVLVVGYAAFQLEVNREGFFGRTTQRVDEGVHRGLLDGNVANLVLINGDGGRHLYLVGHIGCLGSVERVAAGHVQLEIGRIEGGGKSSTVGGQLSICENSQCLDRHIGGVVNNLDVLLLAGSYKEPCKRN